MDESLVSLPWYALQWLSLEQLQRFEWQHPAYLYGLLGLPCLWALLLWQKRYLSHIKVAAEPKTWSQMHSWVAYLHHLPQLVLLLCLGFIALAIARPQKVDKLVERSNVGIDIVLVMDISKSMEIQDLKPNRLQASKRVATKFIAGRKNDRIGLVVFSGVAFSKTPLTQDYDLLKEGIASIDFGILPEEGTAIGSALAVAINRMRESATKSKIIILLSDGENTAGQIDPLTAARLAAAYGIKIYTIAIGREGKVPWGKNILGFPRYVESHIDEKTLQEIANIGGGIFYRAHRNTTLQRIFQKIDRLERSEIKEKHHLSRKDYYSVYLRWAMLCLLLFFFLKSTFLSNILQD